MSQSYQKSISGDFPYGKVSEDRLTVEINLSTIVALLEGMGRAGDTLTVWFSRTLTTGEETTFDAICAAHSGEPLTVLDLIDSLLLTTSGALVTTNDGKVYSAAEGYVS